MLLLESSNAFNEQEEKEHTPDAELRQPTEEKKARMIDEEPHRLQEEGKFRITNDEVRQPRRLSHLFDEQAKERLQDPESDHHDKEECREIERLWDELRMMKEAKVAEEKERERKREEKEEMDRIAAKDREIEHRRQREDMSRVEAEEQWRRERIRIAEEDEMQRTLEQRKALERVEKEDMKRLREAKATRIAGMGSINDEQDDSGEDSSSEAAQPADKNKANNAPSVGTFPVHPSPAPPMFLPSLHPGQYPVDVSPHLWYPPYVGPTSGSPPATNHISGFNNARISGGINIGNVTNSDSTKGGDAGEPSLQETSNVIADLAKFQCLIRNKLQYLVRNTPPDWGNALSPAK